MLLDNIALLNKINMKNVEEYIEKMLGVDVMIENANNTLTKNLPWYLSEGNRFYLLRMLNKEFMLVHVKAEQDLPTAGQAEKWMDIIRNTTQLTPVLLANYVPSLLRNRYIERKINFIVPFKQFFLYDLWINLIEDSDKKKVVKEKLIPAAQLLLLYYLLEDNKDWSSFTFKRIGVEMGVNSMTVTRAIESLESQNLCSVKGSRPKYIEFDTNKRELWEKAIPFLKSPVIKEVYVDSIDGLDILAGESALAELTSMNPPRIPCYAINVLNYRDLGRSKKLVNENSFDGKFKLQVWYYKEDWYKVKNPIRYAMVDPLSLYLSLKDSKDERIQMELEHLINGIKW